MSRDHVASVRLTTDERAQLDALDGPTAVLREITRHLFTNNAASPPRQIVVPITTGGIAARGLRAVGGRHRRRPVARLGRGLVIAVDGE